MKKPQDDLNSRHHSEMHGFIEGSIIVEDNGEGMTIAERELPFHKRTQHIVVSVGGYYKENHIQIDSKNSPWMIAGHYRLARRS